MDAVLSASLPREEHAPTRLAEEALTLIMAGGDTSGGVLTNLMYHLLANPFDLKIVLAELDTVMPDAHAPLPAVSVLEKLPHLHASVREALRLTSLVINRPAMVADNNLVYNDVPIPAGTGVSMSIPAIHLDPSIYEHATEFRPQRWMNENSRALEPYFLPFHRGPRACIGQHLAYAQIYIAAAAVLRRFELELCEKICVSEKVFRRNLLAGMPGGTKNARVRILRRRG